MHNKLNTLKNRKRHTKRIYVTPSLSKKRVKITIKSKQNGLENKDFRKIAQIIKNEIDGNDTDFSYAKLQIQLLLKIYSSSMIEVKKTASDKILIKIT